MIHPQANTTKEIPRVLLIGGSDSSSGAGIQTDLKFINSLDCEGLFAITALTAQSHQKVFDKGEVSNKLFEQQLRTALEQLGPNGVIKTGMFCSLDKLKKFYQLIKDSEYQLVCDPVFRSSSGHELLDPAGVQFFKDFILPRVNILTPNIPEAEVLCGFPIKTKQDMEKAIAYLKNHGPKVIYLKGGHFETDDEDIYDLFFANEKTYWVGARRYPFKSPRGTGCALASSIAAGLALGLGEEDAIILAKTLLQKSIRKSRKDQNFRVLKSQSFLEDLNSEDAVWLGKESYAFAPLKFSTSGPHLYPIVERADMILKLGTVSMVQLRVKDLSGSELEEEIINAIKICEQKKIKLFVNDFWELAIKHKAYGIHLGQQDLETADLKRIESSGLYLGVSSHSYFEAAKIVRLRPSYVALGPIFHTALKAMEFTPQGVKSLRVWKRLFDCPIVAIGGINLERVTQVLEGGADIISVVRDITLHPSPQTRVKELTLALKGKANEGLLLV
ncbi:MAG: thiamine phosphate synthase [Bacteriovoracaceae bacterium]